MFELSPVTVEAENIFTFIGYSHFLPAETSGQVFCPFLYVPSHTFFPFSFPVFLSLSLFY
jgi:hypothetical protein